MKMKSHMIKAILFDSGKVLNSSLMGHWFVSPNFFKHIHRPTFEALSNKRVKQAFAVATHYLMDQKTVMTTKEEFLLFVEFYALWIAQLPELKTDESQVQELAQDMVYNQEKYCFYPEVEGVLRVLKDNYKLGVVSDAWPSLEGVFEAAGLRDMFESFIISSQQGVTKPSPLMYERAMITLDVLPEEVVFVDDNIINCNGASALGISSYLLCRDFFSFMWHALTCRKHRVIRNINDLVKLLVRD